MPTFRASLLRSCVSLGLFACLSVLAAAQNEPIVVRAGKLLNVESGGYQLDRGILVQDGVIVSSGKYSEVRSANPKARLVDLSDSYVLPGLIDCHTHLLSGDQPGRDDDDNLILSVVRRSTAERALLGAKHAREYLESGVTTVRDLGNSGVDGDIALRNAIDAGWVQGPRIVASTRALALPGAQFPTGLNPALASALWEQEYAIVSDEESARGAVRAAFAAGTRVIKVIGDSHLNLFSVSELKAIVEEAHAVHIKVAVHAVYEPEVHNAALAGVDSIEHAYSVTDEDLLLMKEHGVFLVPTDSPLHDLLETSPAPVGVNPGKDTLDYENTIRAAVAGRQERLRHALKLGVKIAFGSDWYYDTADRTRGAASLRTLAAYADSGMPPLEIIRFATINAAELLGMSGRLGVIKPGASADIIAIKTDPLKDVSALEHVSVVMKAGLPVHTSH